jgi:hypothetical protein
MTVARRAVRDLHLRCSYPMRPDAIAASDTCQQAAESAVSRITTLPDGMFWYRCAKHEGLLADGSPGRIHDYITVLSGPPENGGCSCGCESQTTLTTERPDAGCSCGEADYGAPGHDGDPNA